MDQRLLDLGGLAVAQGVVDVGVQLSAGDLDGHSEIVANGERGA